MCFNAKKELWFMRGRERIYRMTLIVYSIIRNRSFALFHRFHVFSLGCQILFFHFGKFPSAIKTSASTAVVTGYTELIFVQLVWGDFITCWFFKTEFDILPKWVKHREQNVQLYCLQANMYMCTRSIQF